MSTFHEFATAVHKRYMELAKDELFVVDGEPDEFYAAYLAAFPEGTNPIFRVNTEHDCSCCKNFIRNLGRVVAIKDNKPLTVWGVTGLKGVYATVAKALDEFVLSREIVSVFRSKEPSYGAESSKELLEGGTVKTWNHFHGKVQKRHLTATPEKARGDINTTVSVFRRGLVELKPDALAQVVELIGDKLLYRGEEHLKAVKGFQQVQAQFLALANAERPEFVFAAADNPAARFRNTVIGTLVQDLSEGVPIEKAVKSFEAKVAPENYKRPKALITPSMVSNAMSAIAALGLESALQRRLANISDISVNNVLWVDRSVKDLMRSSLEDTLMKVAVKSKPKAVSDDAEDISIEQFMLSVAPKASSIQLMVKNAHRGNFVTLTAPVDPEAAKLFKWDNGFAWSYTGNIADSDIRAAVAAKGGRVDGALRFSHSWNHEGRRNASLMDLHVFLPDNRGINHIDNVGEFYGNAERVGWNQRMHSGSGGVQDVDYTSEAPVGYIPVENITFPDLKKLKDGDYQCKVHNWRSRTPNSAGFKAEIEFEGQVFEYDHPKPLQHYQWVTVATVHLKAGKFSITHRLPHAATSQEVWGVQTETPVKVNTVLASPNHWDGNEVGNKHWLFMLDGCKTNEPARGIYNEFLAGGLEQHRKVFEVLGDKTKCPVVPDQLSGLGFSSTRGDKVKVAVQTDRGTRHYTVNF